MTDTCAFCRQRFERIDTRNYCERQRCIEKRAAKQFKFRAGRRDDLALKMHVYWQKVETPGYYELRMNGGSCLRDL